MALMNLMTSDILPPALLLLIGVGLSLMCWFDGQKWPF